MPRQDFWTVADIARITGCPPESVARNWPIICDALEERGIYDRDVCLGVIPTVVIETASTFEPIHEYGTPADWAGYEGGAAYAGRGFPQLTHLGNYRVAGAALGIDLVGNPDLALDPQISARVLAWFWSTKGIPSKDRSRFYTLVELCREHDWYWVRVAVQGGAAGLDRLIAMAGALDAYALPTKEPLVPTFNADTPLILQNDDWSCFATSLRMALEAWGRHPKEGWLESQIIADGVESTALGLLDGSGAAGAAWVTRQYSNPAEGTPTVTAHNVASVSFDDVRSLAGTTALLLGGHHWGSAGHWTFVRRYDPAADCLELGNPAGTYDGIGQTMSRQQFDRVGPCSLVVVTADGAAAPAPPPVVPPADPRDAQLAALTHRVSGLETAVAHLADILAGDRLQGIQDEARAIREQFLGKRPAA